MVMYSTSTLLPFAGTPNHGDSKAAAKAHSPGATWNEPGKHMHWDACPGKEDCISAIFMPTGPFDFIPQDPKAAGGMPPAKTK